MAVLRGGSGWNGSSAVAACTAQTQPPALRRDSDPLLWKQQGAQKRRQDRRLQGTATALLPP